MINLSDKFTDEIAKIIKNINLYLGDQLWPLKEMRGGAVEGHSYPQVRYFTNLNASYSEKFLDPEGQNKQFGDLAVEGEELFERLGEGLRMIINEKEEGEIKRRYPDQAKKFIDTHIIRTKSASLSNKYTPHELQRIKDNHTEAKTFGAFYAEKFRDIFREQSSLTLLAEDNLISQEELQKGLDACTKDLDRLGYNGMSRMIEPNPKLKAFLLNSEKLVNSTTMHGVKGEFCEMPRKEFLKKEFEYIKKMENTTGFNAKDHLEEVYMRALGSHIDRGIIEARAQRMGSTGELIGYYYERNKDRLETPNSELYAAMKSADAEVAKEAEVTFLAKHFMPITDLQFVKDHPELKEVQEHLLNRMREESYLTHMEIEQLFPQQYNKYVAESDCKDPTITDGKITREEYEEPIIAKETIEEPIEVLEGDFIPAAVDKEPSSRSKNFSDLIKEAKEESNVENASFTEVENKAEELIEKSKPSNSRLGFAVAITGFLGAVGYFVYKKTQENKESKESNLSR